MKVNIIIKYNIMMNIFYTIDDIINNAIKINGENPIWMNNKRKDSIPISNKYYITLFDQSINKEINEFFNYLSDDTRTLNYPFKKENDIDYTFMIEPEQMYNIDILQSTLLEISNNLDDFFEIVKISTGDVIFILDINCIIDFLVITKNKSQPNHLIDVILWKLNENKITNILLLDSNNIIKNKSNMFYVQLERCLKNYDLTKYNLDKKITVYRNFNDTVIENIYWNIFYSEEKVEYCDKIKSPIDETYFNIIKIKDKKYLTYELSLSDCINKNLVNLEKDPGIIIEPLDRFILIM